MEILKKQILSAVILFVAFTASAQNETVVRKAYKDSYTQEYNKFYGEAIATLNRVHDDNSYEYNLRMGWLYYMNKNYTQSQVFYQKATSLKPYSIEAKLGLVKPLSVLENWDKVLQVYEEILKIDPQNYTANYWAAVIFFNRKKYDQASKLLEKIVNLYPFEYDGNHLLAWSYFYMNKHNDAKALFNKALLYKPDDTSSLEGLSKIK
jgi:tetratricopeptide (TPR) repeat protein